MPPASNEEQFKFLISCIRYSNNGKVDFTEVARECGIVTKGAAAKRYERMMKAHGIHQPATSVRDTPIPSIRREPKAAPAISKKRKLEQFSDTMSDAADDDEGLGRIKEESSATVIKDEPAAIDENPTSVHGYHYSSGLSNQSLDLDDSSIFSDFLQSGAYEPSTFQPQDSYTGAVDQSVYGNFGNSAPSRSGQDLHESIVITD